MKGVAPPFKTPATFKSAPAILIFGGGKKGSLEQTPLNHQKLRGSCCAAAAKAALLRRMSKREQLTLLLRSSLQQQFAAQTAKNELFSSSKLLQEQRSCSSQPFGLGQPSAGGKEKGEKRLKESLLRRLHLLALFRPIFSIKTGFSTEDPPILEKFKKGDFVPKSHLF